MMILSREIGGAVRARTLALIGWTIAVTDLHPIRSLCRLVRDDEYNRIDAGLA